MWRSALALFLVLALLTYQPYGSPLLAQQPPKLSRHAIKIKDTIEGLGTGSEVRVLVELRDKSKLAGYVKSMQLDGFELFDTVADVSRSIKYEDIKKIKAIGGAWVQGTASGQPPNRRRALGKAAIIVLVALFVVIVAAVASDKS